jgi:hypothetical protein
MNRARRGQRGSLRFCRGHAGSTTSDSVYSRQSCCGHVSKIGPAAMVNGDSHRWRTVPLVLRMRMAFGLATDTLRTRSNAGELSYRTIGVCIRA